MQNKLAIVCIFTILLVVVLSGCNENTDNSQDNVNNDDNQKVNTGNLEITTYTVSTIIKTDELDPASMVSGVYIYLKEEGFVHHENASYYSITGEIKNSANQPYVNVKIIASFYDEDNVYLRNLTDDIWLIAVGEDKDFSLKYENSFDYFDQVESVKLEIIGTIWSDAATDRIVDGELSGSSDGSLGKWSLLSLTNDDDYCYLLDSDGKIEFSMKKYGEFIDDDHVYIAGEYVDLPSVFYAVKIESLYISTTPIIGFQQESQKHRIKITSVESDNILWSDISITGDYNTSNLGE